MHPQVKKLIIFFQPISGMGRASRGFGKGQGPGLGSLAISRELRNERNNKVSNPNLNSFRLCEGTQAPCKIKIQTSHVCSSSRPAD
jgi:hypothetical protein